MFGQGSPSASSHSVGHLLAAIALTLCGGQSECQSQQTGDVETRLHVAWGDGAARKWQGSIRIDSGSITELSTLGLSADAARQLTPRNGQVLVQSTTAGRYNGFEGLVRAPEEATIKIRLVPDGDASSAREIEVPLEQVLNEPFISEQLDDQKNRIFIRRAAGDELGIVFARKNLIFEPEETWQFSIQPNRIVALPSNTQLRFNLSIVNKKTKDVVWSDSRQTTSRGGTFEAIRDIEPTMPSDEGVYDLIVRLSRVRTLRNTMILQRKVQFLVLRETPPATTEGGDRVVAEIDPISSNWLTPKLPRHMQLPSVPLPTMQLPTMQLPRGLQLPQWTLPASWRQGPLSNGKSKRITVGGRAWTELDIEGWQAFPLTIDRVGQAHEIAVEYPTDRQQTLVVSILEANEDGDLIPIGVDTGLQVPKSIVPPAQEASRHRVLFWPRTKTPLLLIANSSKAEKAVFGSMTVSTRSLPPAQSGEGQRLVMAMLDRPLYPENFSAPEAVELGERRRLFFDDWETFYTGANRLIDYLRHVGYSGASVCVFSNGSTIYPSQRLQPTPRHDRGIYSLSGQHPLRKDVLEMLFRMFDRDDLTLIPSLRFATPLPELEQQRQSTGITLVNHRGRSWPEAQGTQRGLAPYYNPLDPRVQRAMRNVVEELVRNYGQHRSFGGLTISMTPDGYTHLPDADWGMDAETLKRFTSETKTAIPEGLSTTAAADYILRQKGLAWLAWRARELAKFYRSLAATVSATNSNARLYLSTAELAESIPIQRSLRPTLPRLSNYPRAMLELGLDQRLGSEPGIQMPRPQYYVPSESLSEGAVSNEINRALQVDRFYHPAESTVFYHQPQQVALPSFDDVSPFKGRSTVLLTHFSDSAEHNRKRLVHSIARHDTQIAFDGGWMIPLGQEAAMKELISTFQQLPARRFQPALASQETGEVPVIVRTLTNRDQTYLYVLNDAPWAIQATLKLAMPPRCRLQRLTDRSINPIRFSNRQPSWTVDLQPYDLVAVRFSKPEVRVQSVAATPSDDVDLALHELLNDVSNRISALKDPVLPQLKNNDFEDVDPAAKDGKTPHWTIDADTTASGRIDKKTFHSGAQSLRLTSAGGRVSASSEPFPTPDAGRFWVAAQLRGIDLAKSTRGRILIEWEVDGRRFRTPFAPRAGEIPKQFKGFLLKFDQIPSEAQNMQLRFELDGKGEIWVDDVKLLLLSQDERIELTKVRASAYRRLEQNRADLCYEQLSGFFPQFVMAHVPHNPAADRVAEKRKPKKPKSNPTMLDKTRNALRWGPKKLFDR